MISVVLSPLAQIHASTIDHWWRENRQSARITFSGELDRALRLLERYPLAGGSYPPGGDSARRVFLARTAFHVYYEYDGARTIRVLAIWAARRGYGPVLPDR